MNKEKIIREISLRQIAWECIGSLPQIIIIMIGLFIIGLVLRYTDLIMNDSGENIENSVFSEETVNTVMAMNAYEEAYNQQIDYINNSLLLNFDPNKVYYYEIICYPKETETEMFLKTDNQELYTQIAKEIGLEGKEAYIGEIIKIRNLFENLEDGETDTEQNGNVLKSINGWKITITFDNKNDCISIGKLVKKQILELNKINVIYENCYLGSDMNIREQKSDAFGLFAGLYSGKETMKVRLTDEERKLYEQEKIGAPIEDNQVRGITRSDVLIAIVFAIIGGFLACVFIIIKLIMSITVKVDDNLEDLLKINVLGIYKGNKDKNKLRDVLLARHYKSFVTKGGMEYIQTRLAVEVRKNSIEKFYVLGECENNINKDFWIDLIEEFKKMQINVEMAFGLLRDKECYEKITAGTAVVILVKTNKSLFGDIIKEIEICNQQDIKVLGIVEEV